MRLYSQGTEFTMVCFKAKLSRLELVDQCTGQPSRGG